MSSVKRNVEKRLEQAQFNRLKKFPLNYQQSVYFTTMDKKKSLSSKEIQTENMIIKKIKLFKDSQLNEQELKKVFSSPIYYIKPEYYFFKDNEIYIFTKVQPFSLQTIIWAHTKESKAISSAFVFNFLIKMFEAIARIKLRSNDIFHQNLKPSNIFYEEVQGEGEGLWLWGQAGLPTNCQSKYYSKATINNNNLSKNSSSLQHDPYEFQFYSLGVMLLEMITLQPVQTLDQTLKANNMDFTRLKGYQGIENDYGRELTIVIKYLLQFPKDNSLNKAIQEYKAYALSKNFSEDRKNVFSSYRLSEQNLERFIDKHLIKTVSEQIRKQISSKEISCSDILGMMQTHDPRLTFQFLSITTMETFLEGFNIKNHLSELVFISSYYTVDSSILYFKLMQPILNAKDLMEAVISKVLILGEYADFKDFFEAQTNRNEVWKADEIKYFFEQIGIIFADAQVLGVVQSWTNSEKSKSIKYDELYRIFKPILGMSMTQSSFKRGNSIVKEDKNDLKFVLQEIMKKQPNLVQFFRKFDRSEKWVVDNKIESEIRNYVKAQSQVFKCAFQQMWEKGANLSKLKKEINYIVLLREMEIYDNYQLFQMILTTRINEMGKEKLFEEYADQTSKAWTYHSLQKFNQKEGLEFDSREMASFFVPLDKDKSGSIDMRELLFRLTGVRQYDQDKIVTDIKEALNRNPTSLFDQFIAQDPKARFLLSSYRELQTVLGNIGVEISKEHCQTLYQQYAKNNKFEYLVFLRYFYDADNIFTTVVNCIIHEHFKDNFDSFFQMGLETKNGKQKKKWTRDSLTHINDNVILGFKSKELDAIWKKIDPDDYQSLSQEEVGAFFKFKVETTEELTRKKLNTHLKDSPKKKRQSDVIVSSDEDRAGRASKKSVKILQSEEENDFLRSLKKIPVMELLQDLFKESEEYSGRIEVEKFIKVVTDLKVRGSRPSIMAVMSRFKMAAEKKVIYLNYVNFIFYLIQEIYSKNDSKQDELKGNVIVYLIKEIKKWKKLKNLDLFGMCRRKEQMKEADLQTILKNIAEVDIYLDDIEPVWIGWGNPEHLTLQYFDQILNSNEYQKEDDHKRTNNIAKKNTHRMDELSVDSNDTPPRNNNKNSRDSKEPDLKSINKHTAQRKDSEDYRRPQRKDSREIKQKQKEKGREREKEERAYTNTGGDRKQKRISIEENQYLSKNNPNSKRNQRDDGSEDEKQLGFTSTKKKAGKQYLLQKLQEALSKKGERTLEELYNHSDSIEKKRFISCLTFNYDFTAPQAEELAEMVSTFGKIKLETIKKHLKANAASESPNKKASKESVDKAGNRRDSNDREASPNKKKNINEEKINSLVDPRKLKLNIPLIKEHIKMLLAHFSKRFSVTDLEAYFFDRSDSICRQDFTKKCFSISSEISTSMYDKIFTYLKPNFKDEVSILSFKLNFHFDQELEIEENYLPEELEKQLRAMFDKADKDKSGGIESHEIESLLSSMGFNETLKEIENYFQKIDTNFDGKVSFSEFKCFIEENILPFASNFDEEVDELYRLLKINDVFNARSLSVLTMHGVLERYGVKLNEHQMLVLAKGLSNSDQISINEFLNAVREPNQASFSPSLKTVLYKIRLRRKINLKDIQKIFQNISSSFVISYTSSVIKKGLLTPSTCYEPHLHESGLFYKDFEYRDIRKVNSQSNEPFLSGNIKAADLVVEVVLKEAEGVPIPQNSSIKNSILGRVVNITLMDLSSQQMKHSVCQVQCEWDRDVEDLWNFDKNNRSLFVKIANYEPRKYEKYVLMFEFIIVINDNNKALEVSCGSASIAVKELQAVDSKITRKLKLTAGIPNKAKDIDKTSISKRSGWKGFLGSQIETEIEIEVLHQSKFKDCTDKLAALPPVCIINRKAVSYAHAFRQFFAEKSIQQSNSIQKVKANFGQDFKVKAFLLSMDVADVYEKVHPFWKEKIEDRIKSMKEGRSVMNVLLQELHLIIRAKEFELLCSFPCQNTIANKSLNSNRAKMVGEVLENVENWVKGGIDKSYRRKKNYGYNYEPFEIGERELGKEHKAVIESIYKLSSH